VTASSNIGLNALARGLRAVVLRLGQVPSEVLDSAPEKARALLAEAHSEGLEPQILEKALHRHAGDLVAPYALAVLDCRGMLVCTGDRLRLTEEEKLRFDADVVRAQREAREEQRLSSGRRLAFVEAELKDRQAADRAFYSAEFRAAEALGLSIKAFFRFFLFTGSSEEVRCFECAATGKVVPGQRLEVKHGEDCPAPAMIAAGVTA
jgi:hypothetical protein